MTRLIAGGALELYRGLKQLARSPGFAIAAILLLGTGIGAVTTVYSLISAVLLKPLPYLRADELVGIQAVNRGKSLVQPAISVSDFRDLAARQKSLRRIGAYRPDFATWQRPGEQPLQLSSALVTEGFFEVLGVPPLLGRTFVDEEFTQGTGGVVVISELLWRSRFRADPEVIGSVITINDRATVVIGVMPSKLREPTMVETWQPFARDAGENFARDSRYWVALGRRAEGSSVGQVDAEVAGIAQDLEKQHVETNRGWSMAAAPLHSLRVRGVASILWLLFGATGLLLLVACFNLASLLLGRGIKRRNEMALRQALGGSSQRLVAQVLCENLGIAIPGAVVGITIAFGAIQVFLVKVPPQLLPRAAEVSVDWRVLMVATLASIVASVLSGIFPALQAARVDLGELIKEGGARSGASPTVRRTQRLLLVAQVSITFVVLTGSTLLWRSLAKLSAVNPGFDPADVYAVSISPAPSQYESTEDLALYFEKLVSAVARVPGIESAALDPSLPLGGLALKFPYHQLGAQVESGTVTEAVYHFVSADYGHTLRLPLRAGRDLAANDDPRGEAVVWVNETLARILAPAGDVVGRQLTLVPWLSQRTHRIVGVFGDVRQNNLSDPPPPQLFVSQKQVTWFFSTLIVRTPKGQALPVAALRDALQKVDGALPGLFQPYGSLIAETTVQAQLLSQLFLALALSTLAFTLFGVYACVSFAVAQRTQEFGLRLALGASPTNIACHVGGEVGILVVSALVLGVLGAAALGGVLRSQLFEVGSHDPLSLGSTALILTVATLASAAIPVVRAASVSPATALRHS